MVPPGRLKRIRVVLHQPHAHRILDRRHTHLCHQQQRTYSTITSMLLPGRLHLHSPTICRLGRPTSMTSTQMVALSEEDNAPPFIRLFPTLPQTRHQRHQGRNGRIRRRYNGQAVRDVYPTAPAACKPQKAENMYSIDTCIHSARMGTDPNDPSSPTPAKRPVAQKRHHAGHKRRPQSKAHVTAQNRALTQHYGYVGYSFKTDPSIHGEGDHRLI